MLLCVVVASDVPDLLFVFVVFVLVSVICLFVRFLIIECRSKFVYHPERLVVLRCCLLLLCVVSCVVVVVVCRVLLLVASNPRLLFNIVLFVVGGGGVPVVVRGLCLSVYVCCVCLCVRFLILECRSKFVFQSGVDLVFVVCCCHCWYVLLVVCCGRGCSLLYDVVRYL